MYEREKKRIFLSLYIAKQNEWPADNTHVRYISSHLLKEAVLKIFSISHEQKDWRNLTIKWEKL